MSVTTLFSDEDDADHVLADICAQYRTPELALAVKRFASVPACDLDDYVATHLVGPALASAAASATARASAVHKFFSRFRSKLIAGGDYTKTLSKKEHDLLILIELGRRALLLRQINADLDLGLGSFDRFDEGVGGGGTGGEEVGAESAPSPSASGAPEPEAGGAEPPVEASQESAEVPPPASQEHLRSMHGGIVHPPASTEDWLAGVRQADAVAEDTVAAEAADTAKTAAPEFPVDGRTVAPYWRAYLKLFIVHPETPDANDESDEDMQSVASDAEQLEKHGPPSSGEDSSDDDGEESSPSEEESQKGNLDPSDPMSKVDPAIRNADPLFECRNATWQVLDARPGGARTLVRRSGDYVQLRVEERLAIGGRGPMLQALGTRSGPPLGGSKGTTDDADSGKAAGDGERKETASAKSKDVGAAAKTANPKVRRSPQSVHTIHTRTQPHDT